MHIHLADQVIREIVQSTSLIFNSFCKNFTIFTIALVIFVNDWLTLTAFYQNATTKKNTIVIVDCHKQNLPSPYVIKNIPNLHAPKKAFAQFAAEQTNNNTVDWRHSALHHHIGKVVLPLRNLNGYANWLAYKPNLLGEAPSFSCSVPRVSSVRTIV